MAFNVTGASGIPLTIFGGLVTEIDPLALPEGCSSDNADVMYLPGTVYSRPAFQRVFATPLPPGGANNLVPTIVAGHSFTTKWGDIQNLYFGSNGVMWMEDFSNQPGTYSQLFQSTPGSFARFVNCFGRVWIAISDGLHATDIAYQWDGKYLARVTQDGPGAAPSVISQALPASQLTSGGTTLSRSNNIVTATTATAHGLQAGYQAQISNVPDSNSTSVVQTNNSSNQVAYSGWSLNSGQWRTNFNPGTSPLNGFIAQGFGFNLPSNSTVLGVIVTFGTVAQSTTTGTVYQVALWEAGAQQGTLKSPATPIQTTSQVTSYGSAADLWGASLTPAIINSPTFGFAISCQCDSIRVFLNFPFTVQVYYTQSGSGTVANISSIKIDNEALPGEALVTTTVAHAMVPGIYVSIVGVEPAAVANVASAQWSSGTTTLTTSANHNLNPGAVIQVASVTTSTTSTTFSFNGTWTVATVPAPNQVSYFQSPITATDPDVITATPSTGSITVAWPIPTNTPTPTYFEVLSCPTPTTFYIQVNYSDATWTTGTVGFIWEGTFYVTAILSPTQFQYQQYGPNGATSAIGTVTPWGQCAPGLHLCQVLFQLQDGAITEPSPPVTFVANGGQYVAVSNIPTGPNNVVARILAFTGAQPLVPGILPPFFYLPVPAQLEGQVVSTATQINDNTTESALLDFSDNSLFATAAELGAISVPGNNLVNQIVIDGALGFAYFESRLTTWGQRARVQNFLNLGFEGGAQSPLGWNASQNTGGSIVAGKNNLGLAYRITGSAGVVGQISQSAYLDAYGAPILDGSTNYALRCWVNAVGTGSADSVTFTISSVLGGFTLTATIRASSIPAGGGWVQVTFSGATPLNIPADTLLTLYSRPLTAGATITVDEISIFDANNPYSDDQCCSSYSNNPTGFDGVSGNNGPADDTRKIMDFVLIRDAPYAVTQDPAGRVHEISTDPTAEPSGWRWRQIQANCGTLSAFSVTHAEAADHTASSGDDWASWAMEGGIGLFDGGQVHKISQEIQPNWFDPYSLYPWMPASSAVNMNAATTISSLNDPVERMLYFFVPVGNNTAPSQIYCLSYRELNNTYAIVNSPPIHVSLGGKLIVTDNTRKWTHWLRPMNGAARMYRQGTNQLTTVFFAGNGQTPGAAGGYGNCYTLSIGKQTDDDYGQIFPYYTTAYLPDPEKAAGLGLTMTRLIYAYVFAMISGVGQVTYSVLVDTPTHQWPLSITRNLSQNPTFPHEFAGCQAMGYKMALRIASSPIAGTDNSFHLSWLRNYYKKSKVPLRGAAQ